MTVRGDGTRLLGDVAERPNESTRGPVSWPRVGIHPARVALGIEDLGLHQEVIDYLGRDPRVEVVGAVPDGARFRRLLVDLQPDVGLVCPVVAADLRSHITDRSWTVAAEPLWATMVVAQEMTVPVLREAIDLGAQGVFGWPEERTELTETILRARIRTPEAAPRGQVIAVLGARGGAGSTFVATHLTAALADRGRRAVLVDLDHAVSDISCALGIGPATEARTVEDLFAVVDELSPDHVEACLYRHSRGFGVLLGPRDSAGSPEAVPERRMAGLYAAAIALLAHLYEVVVVHVPRTLSDVAHAGISLADRVVLVSGLDLFSLYGARRAINGLDLADPAGRCCLVTNAARRSLLSAKDVERVLGTPPATGLRFDPGVRRAQERGELLPHRSRGVWRDIERLAGLLLQPVPVRAAEGSA